MKEVPPNAKALSMTALSPTGPQETVKLNFISVPFSELLFVLYPMRLSCIYLTGLYQPDNGTDTC